MQLIKCSKCGKEQFNTRMCSFWGKKRIICVECCDAIQSEGKCRVRGCPYRKNTK